MKARLQMVCAHCGGSNVFRDACAEWNVDTQKWEMVTVYDNADCADCDGETRIESRPVGEVAA